MGDPQRKHACGRASLRQSGRRDQRQEAPFSQGLERGLAPSLLLPPWPPQPPPHCLGNKPPLSLGLLAALQETGRRGAESWGGWFMPPRERPQAPSAQRGEGLPSPRTPRAAGQPAQASGWGRGANRRAGTGRWAHSPAELPGWGGGRAGRCGVLDGDLSRAVSKREWDHTERPG